METEATDPLAAIRQPVVDPTAANSDRTDLGRDAFLKIFLTQLQNQDPLTPQDSSELSAQLASFSQLEQSLAQTDEARGMNERLDQLIELLGSSAPTSIDPISLIGHEVQVQNDTLFAPIGAGSSAPLAADIARNQNFLLIEAIDETGESVGMAVVGSSNLNETLQGGTYRVRIEDQGLKLDLPDGSTLDLSLEEFDRDEEGNVILTGELVDRPFGPGAPYRFELVQRGVGTTSLVTTSLNGVVDGVSIRNGQPVLTVNGTEVDPSRIVRVR